MGLRAQWQDPVWLHIWSALYTGLDLFVIMFMHAVLDTHFSYLGCLSRTMNYSGSFLVVVNERLSGYSGLKAIQWLAVCTKMQFH